MSNTQKTPLSRTLPQFVQQKVLDQISQLGLGVPGHVTVVDGAIVTVSFDVTGLTLPLVQMPVAESAYVRLPIQVGDKGVAIPATWYLGGVSGLGGGTADTTQRGNLATLVWFPVGNQGWPSVNPNALVLQGPDGVVEQDAGGNTTSTLTPNGVAVSAKETYAITAGTSITFSVGGVSIVINASGVTIDGVPFLPHTHSGVESGSDDSGPVVP
jgi:hypothetical protein